MATAIPYGKQHITEADIKAVTEVLRADYLTTGPKVDAFEQKFADYVGARYAIALSNGTAALHLCALALGVNQKSKVITTPITFAASANCVRYCGGEIDFCDIAPDTLTLDIEQVRKKLEAAPAGTYQGIIPVDFAGYPVDLEQYRALADEFNLWIIEDACHAPGGYFTDTHGKQQNCGNGAFADLAIFSFHPVKHIACGEGGMVTTNDEELYHKIKQLRTHGMVYQGDERLQENHGRWYMELQELGYNYRIPDILCALGISQLDRAEAGIQRRRAIAQKYDEAFRNTQIGIHQPAQGIGHAYHLYVIEVDNRKELYDALRSQGIYAQVHYVPLHTMPYYQQYGFKKGDFPVAEAYYKRGLSLPMYPTLTEEEQDYVIEQVKAIAG
ncbi:MAG TPA: UDP-4-amino-4,6-dideoxy-N-acetyl-beta-L-altrosamine transaminase [Saprospiraceae bacterium]|nr:UDP-4-amino-4,6-dideoxy-N-acetyl-beta-L-altrosamine transaminase [Saprospiraceae bacterium]